MLAVDELCQSVKDAVISEDTKLMLTFLTGKYLDVYSFVERCNDFFPGVQMIGGLANTSEINLKKFLDSGFVFNENGWSSKGIVLAAISGSEVESYSSYATGVEVIGKEREITDTFGTCILTMDGKDAASEYRVGIGDELKTRPELTNLFPFVYSQTSDIPIMVRFSDDQSIEDMFPKDNELNEQAYSAHAGLDTASKREMINANHNVQAGKKLKRAFIYDGKIIADNRKLFRHIENFEKAETIFGYSCIARSMIYSNCVKWELSAYENSNICGCITEGEIAHVDGKNTFANCSFVVSVIGEAPATQTYNPYAFSHTDSLAADNTELLTYLYDVENKLISSDNSAAAESLKRFVRDCELKLLYSQTDDIPNGAALNMDIKLKGYDRIWRYLNALPLRADQEPFPSGPPIVPDWPETRDEFQITRQLRGRRDDIPNYGYAEQLRYYIFQNGQCQESSRDQAHTVVGLSQLVAIAELFWIQGDDLYGALDNRILLGLEWSFRYNEGDWQPSGYTDDEREATYDNGLFYRAKHRSGRWVSLKPNPSKMPFFGGPGAPRECAYAHYRHVKRLPPEKMKHLRAAILRENRNSGGFETWGFPPNWFYEWSGWGTLMKRR